MRALVQKWTGRIPRVPGRHHPDSSLPVTPHIQSMSSTPQKHPSSTSFHHLAHTCLYNSDPAGLPVSAVAPYRPFSQLHPVWTF